MSQQRKRARRRDTETPPDQIDLRSPKCPFMKINGITSLIEEQQDVCKYECNIKEELCNSPKNESCTSKEDDHQSNSSHEEVQSDSPLDDVEESYCPRKEEQSYSPRKEEQSYCPRKEEQSTNSPPEVDLSISPLKVHPYDFKDDYQSDSTKKAETIDYPKKYTINGFPLASTKDDLDEPKEESKIPLSDDTIGKVIHPFEDGELADDEEGPSGEAMAMAMRGFDVLDDLDPNEDDEDDHDDDGLGMESDGSYDSDVPQDEIEAMLEEGLRSEKNKDGENADNASSMYCEKEKIVLEEMGYNHFDVLPEGWIQVTHNSGMPVFLHRATRVCTLAKPYFLGPGSARKHEVPLSGIPCLQYQRALEQEQQEKREQERILEEAAKALAEGLEVAPPMPSARIETAQENKESQSLTSTQVQDYCRKRFNFKVVKVLRFKSWSDRRNHTKNRKHQRQLQRPTLPEGTKLIKFPVQNCEGNNGTANGSNRANKEWIMNPNGKSYVCILHEYVQHALKKQPSYQFKELENAATPYSATVTINVMQYGVGYGTSKKQAKSDAAKATLEILIPEMRDKIKEDSRVGARGTSKGQDTDLSFFDEIKIKDPRVAELCAKTTEPAPYVILLTCLQRNFGLGEMHIKYDVNSLRHQKNEFTMEVGRHSAKVVCKNKRDGKQRASQAILQLLHPHITSWGSLLRLYGNRSVKNVKEKKQDEQEITLLQSKASVNSPNFAILEKLSAEMRGLKQRKAEVQPIGRFMTSDLPTGNGADLNNVDL